MNARQAAELVEDLMVAPVGLALLARLEGAQRDDCSWWDVPLDSSPAAVEHAVSALATMAWGELIALATQTAAKDVGPWSSDSLMNLPRLYEDALARRPLAEALVAHFGDRLRQDIDRQRQEWWCDKIWMVRHRLDPCFEDLTRVYANGVFTGGGLFTCTEPPQEATTWLVYGWDFISSGPYVRWNLPVRPEARVYEVHRPADWNRLVETYPHVTTSAHDGWELPGPNQHRSDINHLRRIPGQRAMRDHVATHLLPEWTAVCADYDGVHLSWAGFLTCEGVVSDLDDGAVTMLRHWASERTEWLRDVFTEPEALPDVEGNGYANSSLTDEEVSGYSQLVAHNRLLAHLGRRPGQD